MLQIQLQGSSSILVVVELVLLVPPNHALEPSSMAFTSEKVSRLRMKIEKVMKDLPEGLRDIVTRHQDR